jgi:hypothetical protein
VNQSTNRSVSVNHLPADFEHRRPEKPNVDHVPLEPSDFDSVTDLEWPSDEYEGRPVDVLEEVGQTDRNTGRHDTDMGGEIAERIHPNPGQGG